MSLLRQLSVAFFFLAAAVSGQHDPYQVDEEYDDEGGDAHSPAFYFRADRDDDDDDEASARPSPFGCAAECFCPLAFPTAMYCDNRQLKTVPTIPPHIQQVYLQFNDIEAVSSRSFANATGLREIHLGHNKIRSPKMERDAFGALRSLRQLHLDHNGLEDFPGPLPGSVESLLLGHNEISRVAEHALRALPNLTTLDLGHNRLHDASFKGTLSQSANLRQLNLGSNRLRSLPPWLPPSLLQLSLENNSVALVPDKYFQRFPNLLALRISHNQLRDVPYDVFNVSSLVELHAGHNRLRRAFYVPRSLEHLYLEGNEMEHINVSLMCPSVDPLHYHRLTYLRLDQNRLQEPIGSSVFSCFPYIHSIYYGEQRRPDGQTVHLKTQLFRSFRADDEEEEDAEGRDPEGQEPAGPAEDPYLDPSFY
ncbi:osteomodulin [Monodelphis domestica]|uniref:osteomodulin n=1 Tax=Monodelphis domestica TaxID=13616 RepID=UPI0024E25E25|nr:osteomodulin [Monodelphis domestica]